MDNEPKWRTALNWGAVITFFTAPLVVFILQITSQEFSWLHFQEHMSEFKWLGNFYLSVTGLVFGLAGLNSFDRYNKANGKK
jgi:hypothetical protein